jgi:UDP-glucose 4-epimerase
VSILGERYTHGHIIDFYRQLQHDRSRLRVLGDGRQRKSYLYIHDCIDAMLLAIKQRCAGVSIINLGHDSYCAVNDSIGWICAALGAKPNIEYGGGYQGWIGDNPFIFLDSQRARALGWTPKLSIEHSVIRTVEYLRANPDILDARR